MTTPPGALTLATPHACTVFLTHTPLPACTLIHSPFAAHSLFTGIPLPLVVPWPVAVVVVVASVAAAWASTYLPVRALTRKAITKLLR